MQELSKKQNIIWNEKGLDSSVDQHGATFCIIDLTYDTSEVIKPLESHTP